MFQVICLVCFLLVSGVNANAQEFKKEFQEPTIDKLVEWIPEEVPRTVSFYFDTDGDGLSDLIVAYHLIESYACKELCSIELREFNDHWILVSSIGHNPQSYFIIKKWSLWKHTKKEDWRSVEKSSDFVYKYKTHEEWYQNEFLKRRFLKKEN